MHLIEALLFSLLALPSPAAQPVFPGARGTNQNFRRRESCIMRGSAVNVEMEPTPLPVMSAAGFPN
jgi:hypothetical protein